MNIIHTQKAPAAIGPYSQGYAVNDLVFTSRSDSRGSRHRRHPRGHRRPV